MIIISSYTPARDEWTAEDRLKVIASLSDQFCLLYRSFTVNLAVDIAQRINFVAAMPQSFLQKNRATLLQGFPVYKED